MDARAMDPHGLALVAYYNGANEAQITVRRDDGLESVLPVGYFFRDPDEFTPIERVALNRCQGHVLDIGAGTGLHALALQTAGISVTAIDLSEAAVEIMKQRGVRSVQRGDVFQFEGGPFDTLLLLGHGIGMVEDLWGLNRFLTHAHRIAGSNGRILAHSMDVQQTGDPVHLAYHAANRRAGRYVGATRLQFEFEGQAGPYCGWLHVDPQVLQQEARSTGWECEIILEQEGGDYLACLTDIEQETGGG